MGFLAVMMAGIIFTSCEQEQIIEVGESPTVLESSNLEQNIISGEFVDHITFFETNDFVPHHYMALGISPVAYRLDKQNPRVADFIQLIKGAGEGTEPLKVTIDESGKYFTKVAKVSETEERKWQESSKGKVWNKENIVAEEDEIDSRRLGPITFNNFNEVNGVFQLMDSYRCQPGGINHYGCISFNYKPDGCYARAHRMKQLIESNYNKTCNKIFIFADIANGNMLSVPGCLNTEWLYHVAPYVEIAGGTGYVIDPSIFTLPVTVDSWTGLMGVNNSCGQVIKSGNTYTPLPFASYNCGLGQFITDPTYFRTYADLAVFQNLSGC